MKPILENVSSPDDLKGLELHDLEQLCCEIREFLIENVSHTGGHLSSNLGTVELTVALHRIFHSPRDKIVFDVGHQCYTHKLLTGRREGFARLRQQGGLSGFPMPSESPHDIFIAGHGSTSLSAAVGLARAKKLKKEPGYVIVLVGDGAFTGGMIYEAMNNLDGLDNLIIILNDNKMSISKNDGSLARYFTHLRTNPQYHKAKNDIKNLLASAPLIGPGMVRGIQNMKSTFRRSIYRSTFFEEMGLQYIGPIDGHDLLQLCNLFVLARTLDKPLLLHIETVKGKGFEPAEQNPGAFHGVSAFDAQTVTDPDVSPSDSFSTAFGQALARAGGRDERICAVTAAMKYGTGLQYFKKQHRRRFFDVGMAEAHAVTFAAGLARSGLVPVVAIYSTFLQRAYDQIIHDVVLQNLNVLLAIDRAGLVPGDGATHQGIYDAAYLSQQAGLPVVSPANYAELEFWLKKLLEEYEGPRAIRYPRGRESERLCIKPCSGEAYDVLARPEGARDAMVTYGCETEDVLEAAEKLQAAGQPVAVYQMVVINPLPHQMVQDLLKYERVLFAEEGILQGGIGEHLAMQLYKAGFRGKFIHKGITGPMVDHASVPELKAEYGLDGAGLAAALQGETAT